MDTRWFLRQLEAPELAVGIGVWEGCFLVSLPWALFVCFGLETVVQHRALVCGRFHCTEAGKGLTLAAAILVNSRQPPHPRNSSVKWGPISSLRYC